MNHRLPRRSLTKSGASGWVCTRFVGAEDGKFDVKELIKPPLTTDSQPEDLNDLLGYFLGEGRALREEYRRAIGR